MDDVDLNLLGALLDQRVGQGFGRAVDVALDDEVELLVFAHCNSAPEFFEGDLLLCPNALLALQLLALLGDGAGFLFVFENVELVTGIGRAIQSQDGDRC